MTGAIRQHQKAGEMVARTAMKLGIISTIGGGYSWAGSEEMWKMVATHALSKGYSVGVHAAATIARSTQLDALRLAGLVTIPREELNAITRRLAERNLFCRFKRFFATRHDVILLSMGGIADCVWIPDLLAWIRRSSTPLVIIVQANAEGIVQTEAQREVLRSVYNRAATVIFVSHHNLKLAERQLAWRFPNATLIPNPLREPLQASLPWPTSGGGRLRFAQVARLDVTDKQQDHILEALATDAWRNRSWLLTFFGSGPDENHIRRLINLYDLKAKVSLGGFVSDFQAIWRDHHLHILTSRREGMPLSLIESMACGRPALVTHAGASTELVKDGVHGFVSPGMHPEVLRETLERAWARRDQFHEMGMAAHERITELANTDCGEAILPIIETAARS